MVCPKCSSNVICLDRVDKANLSASYRCLICGKVLFFTIIDNSRLIPYLPPKIDNGKTIPDVSQFICNQCGTEFESNFRKFFCPDCAMERRQSSIKAALIKYQQKKLKGVI